MKIQDAIDMLTEAKAKGVKNIVHAFWTADCFSIGRIDGKFEDDKDWEGVVALIEEMDWSWVHDDMMEIITYSSGLSARQDREEE